MKNTSKIITALFLLLSFSLSSFAKDNDEPVKVDGIYYLLNKDAKTASVTYKEEHVIVSEYEGSISIPKTIQYSGINYTVTSIGERAFTGDTSRLTSISIPNSVTSIGKWAFLGCSALTSITIPNGVTSIGDGAFSRCSGLTTIKVDKSNPVYNDGDGSNCIIETSTNTLVQGCKTTIIPNNVESIGNQAFWMCDSLTSITIPNSVKSIGDEAFAGCDGLTSITIPNGVTSIGDKAFLSCDGLTSITIPNGVTSIGNRAFEHCIGLTSITISNGVTSIGDYAFYGCSGLTSVTIPNSVTSIGEGTFLLCSGLTSVTIPNSVTSIEAIAFLGSGLTSVTIPNSVTSIGNRAFEHCIGLTSITISNGVTSIGDYAFYGCSGLTSVTIPNSVTSIGEGTFLLCSGLTSVTIPNSVSSIGDEAFKFCFGLTSITIPNSVKTIGKDAFKDCVNLPSFDQKAEITMNSAAQNKAFTVNGVSFTMIEVEGGTFMMGATSEQLEGLTGDELLGYDASKPTHRVTLSSYYIGQTEVTQALWQAVMGDNPSSFKGYNQCPVESVSWDDCQTFISKLNSMTGQNFRLPSEAEWEFAARGGTKSKGYKYSGSNTLGNVGWYGYENDWRSTGNSDEFIHPVSKKSANELGIYDMSGNIWEWCQDWYGDYNNSSQTNPKGPSSGSFRVLRGGSCANYARLCRVSLRNGNYPDSSKSLFGLRLAL